MQLFILHRTDHALAARWHFDSHVTKIPLEVAQLLSIALHIVVPKVGAKAQELGLCYKYAKSYAKHPCAKWMLEREANASWAIEYGLALCDEYYERYGKHKKEPCQLKARAVIENVSILIAGELPDGEMTEFAQALPDELKVDGDAEAAYRGYYQSDDKAHLRRWKHGEPPEWFADSVCVPKKRKRAEAAK